MPRLSIFRRCPRRREDRRGFARETRVVVNRTRVVSRRSYIVIRPYFQREFHDKRGRLFRPQSR